MIRNFLNSVSLLNRSRKRLILLAYDLLAMCLALWGALSTRLGVLYQTDNLVVLASAAFAFGCGVLALYYLRIYHHVLRYFDLRTVSRIFVASAVSALAWSLAVYFTRAPYADVAAQGLVPRSVTFIYFGFLFVLLFMGRYCMTILISGAATSLWPASRHGRKNVAIYGANAAGIALADSVRSNPGYRLSAFIDDDAALHGQIAAGIPILSPTSLDRLAEEAELDEVFLAMPKATRSERLAAISRLTKLSIQVKTVPAPEEIVSGRFTVSDVRPVDVNDLLRRDPIVPLTVLIQEAVEGRSILITGAGGSIGSEICRQIARGRPKKLVLLDHSEFALYSIEQQLEEHLFSTPADERPKITPVVGSMLNEQLVRDLIAAEKVDTIYHAAAYKHVPLLEKNEVIGVQNNVVSTLILARAAIDAKLTRFTMISTDKAVRPESVMGASKRVAELIVQALAHEPDCPTRFGIVRFGNVLDSSGSVVQRFREQIRRGGPITVTHPDITRFFMSIPEATQLVLQASAMAEGGEVFVLDMGEPIKIAHLARNMINLSGMTVRDDENPHGDIGISFVGLRPGEKLYEELFVGEEVVETAHPRIRMAKERFVPWAELEPSLVELNLAIEAASREAVRSCLRRLIAPDQGHLD
jgi:FlaA1/EpsC-like NDP-sugar epimerase